MANKKLRHSGYKIFNKLSPEERKNIEEYCNHQAQLYIKQIEVNISNILNESIIKACRGNRVGQARAERIVEAVGKIFQESAK